MRHSAEESYRPVQAYWLRKRDVLDSGSMDDKPSSSRSLLRDQCVFAIKNS